MFEDIVKRWQRANPIKAHDLGIHDFDGMLPNFSEDAVNKRIMEIQNDLETLIKSYRRRRNKIKKLEVGLIISALETELFELQEQKEYTKSPIPWIYPLIYIEISYANKDYTDLDTRIKHIISLEASIPEHIDTAYNILDKTMAKPKIHMAISFLKGIIAYLSDMLITVITGTDDEELINQWSEVNVEAIDKLNEFLSKLENEYLGSSHDNFALGEEKFLKLLKHSEGIDTSIEELLEVGKRDLETNYQELLDTAGRFSGKSVEEVIEMVQADIIGSENMIDEVKTVLERTQKFVKESGVIKLPTNDIPEVVNTPEFARNMVFAAMYTPGPFESKEVAESYYWITPPNPAWPAEQQTQFMKFFNRALVEVITIHEAFPGHFVQLLYNNKSKSRIAKTFAWSITMIEGWAHYCEKMALDEGYVADNMDPNVLKIGQILSFLLRNVRFIVAIKMHCQNMSLEEASKMFREKAFLPEQNAKVEANRGTIDPMYLNYTLGRLLVNKLRQDYTKEKGNAFDLSEFHSELLSYGSPPISILREVMLDNPQGNML